MARKQSHLQHDDVEVEGQGAQGVAAKGAAISKADAIRAALRAGIESPTEAEMFIRKRFGIAVSRGHFSAFKSQAKKAASLEGSGALEGYLAPPSKLEAIGDGDLLDALEKMKPLVASLGPERLKRIVDLLG